MDRTGKCLCGAVHFNIRDCDLEFRVCHCKMCQRWAGSALLGLTVPAETISFEGTENIARYQSSDWAERAWCKKCGSGLWYQVTVEGPHHGIYHMPIGLLDNTSGLNIYREIYVEEKPDCISFEGECERLDTAATLAFFGVEG